MDDFDFNMYNNNEQTNKENNTGDAPQMPKAENNGSFYTETYRKVKPRKNIGLIQLVIVALISSMFGGGLVFGAFQFVVPAVKPAVDSYFSGVLPKSQNVSSTDTSASNYKKIEITQSDSPVTAIVEKVKNSIVGIKVTAKVDDFFFGQSEGGGEGSGIIIKSDGYILTNNHVVESALSTGSNKLTNGSRIEVILPNERDKTYQAIVVGRDSKTDLAVLKIEKTGLPAAELGNSDQLKVGELAVAIGNPGGLEYMGSVTVGVISGLNRSVPVSEDKQLKLIQTDAAINPGNSGGALLNSQGQVVGINSVKFAAQGFEGMGFAIPMNQAKTIVDDLMNFQYVKNRPKLGVTIEPSFNEDVAKQYNVPIGLLVYDVEPLSGAYKAGIQRNDIITKFDGVAVKVFDDLETQKNKHKPGDTVKIEVYRDGKTLTLSVTLGEDKGTN